MIILYYYNTDIDMVNNNRFI